MATQFETNSDYPPEGTPIRRRGQFGPPNIDQSDNISTYILFNTQVILADNVIVPQPRRIRPPTQGDRANNADSSDDDTDSDYDSEDEAQLEESSYAFWSQRQVKKAIYGGVYSGVILRRCSQNILNPNGQVVQWEATEQRCAVKQYNRNKIQEAQGSAEDPLSEIAAMQYLYNYQRHHLRQTQGDRILEEQDFLQLAQENMYECNVMMPLAVYYDRVNIYSIMPYVDGGELFDVLDERQHFSEEESRHWLHQILNGVEHLQRAGICHRDMSLENILTDTDGRALVIDLGMCLKIPYMDDAVSNEFRTDYRDHRQRQRCFIRRSNTCGKPYYMSPEIRWGNRFFDGHAVDMWALGPILFLMVTGFPPFEIADNSDERFHYFSNGYLADVVRNWNLGLSEDLIDLLQRMMWLDARNRLSLDQVRRHPWMRGERTPPPPAET